MRPPLTKPMKRMNRPMPTPIDRLRASGTAVMIASRRPRTTRMVMRTPSITITPMAPATVRPLPAIRVNATIALMPRPAARASGYLPMTPMAMVMMPAMRAVAAA